LRSERDGDAVEQCDEDAGCGAASREVAGTGDGDGFGDGVVQRRRGLPVKYSFNSDTLEPYWQNLESNDVALL